MYDSKTLIALPNPVKTINNNAEKKVYNKTSSISSAVCILFAGAMMLKGPVREGLIVIRYYLALQGAENGVTAMVTPFFCVQG